MNAAATMRQGTAAEAFSLQAAAFDRVDAANPLIGWVRDRVRAQAIHQMRPGERLLELNAGTGIDSAYFAERGMQVMATDIAPGMVAQQQEKIRTARMKWSARRCSFLELHLLGPVKAHHVFSNFGGLNCTDRLDLVLDGVDRLLLPGGTCTMVIMPRFSPWESLALLKGNIPLAMRRWRQRSPASLEGVVFPCHYHAARTVIRLLGDRYEVVAQRALGLFVPPPHHERIFNRWPTLFRVLAWLEDRTAAFPLLRNWGDHYVITLRKRP